ncbi:hypothetical protein RJ639_024923 [Escallonia herrerae]|uniref:Protein DETOXIFICATION n=1 Tax=Escallonia herrerae TaxID=1293975 RepID=A0AA88UXI3_9ASTE|nr:hypothetical protein RJ639_024923 [Escallonia herrerae]
MAENGDLPAAKKKWTIPLFVFFKDARLVFKMDDLGLEIIRIALPAAMALAADPIASLVDTAFIGHLGPVEIAAVGVSIAIFNQASKVTIFPLVSITTSFVAKEETVERIASEAQKGESLEKASSKNNEMKELIPEDVVLENMDKGSGTKGKTEEVVPEDEFTTTVYKSPNVTSGSSNKHKLKSKRRHIPSASTALIIGAVLGLLQTVFLICLAKPILGFMGVKSGSPMLTPALRYLTVRSLGAPAVLLSLAMQGVFRGFKDTKTPLYATGKDTSVGASGVAEENVVAERGRDPLPPIGGKKGGRGQSKSRDTIVSLDERTCVLEETMGDVKDRLGYVEQNLQTLEDQVLEELESLKKAVMDQDELRTRFMELFANLQEQLDVVKVGVEETRQETAMCKRAIAGGVVVTHSPRVDAPKPKEFGGKRDAKELDNFIWHMERSLNVLASRMKRLR